MKLQNKTNKNWSCFCSLYPYSKHNKTSTGIIKIRSPSSHSVWVPCNRQHKRDDSIHVGWGQNIGPANTAGCNLSWKISDSFQGLRPNNLACSCCGRANRIAQAVRSCTHTHTWHLALWWSHPSWWSWCDTGCSCWTNPHFHQGYLQDNYRLQ